MTSALDDLIELESTSEGRIGTLTIKSITPPENCLVDAFGIRAIWISKTGGIKVEFAKGGGFGKPVPEKQWIPTKQI